MHDGALVKKKHLDAMLAGGPVVAQQVIDATRHRLRDSGGTLALAADRQQLFALLEALQLQQAALVARFGDSIKSEIEAASQAPSDPMRLPASPLRLEDLTLMDEDQAEKDIEISRTIQLIDLKAEWELRELQALTATLLGESVLRLEANPCRPMVYARALNHAADVLQVGKAGRGLFLRTAGFAMADVLRDVYGDACRRLKSWGVQPLEFRSAPIVRAGTTPDVDLTQPGALLSLRDRLPVDPGQPQTAALLSRLFEQILADPHLEATVKDVIGRLRSSVLRVALKDPSLMTSHEHPTWNLINQIAAHASDHPQFSDSRGSAFMAFVEPLIEQLAVDETPDAAKYESALSDVQAFIDREDDTQLEHSQAAVKALAEAEQRQFLLPLLRQQVMHQLQHADLSPTLRRFLIGPWVAVLAQTMVSHGADSAGSQALVGVVDELLWSLERPAGEPHREALRQRLPALIERLKQGMAMIQLPQSEQDQVLDELMRVHSRRLRVSPAVAEVSLAESHSLVQQMRDEVLDDDGPEHRLDTWTQDTSVGSLPTVPMALSGAEEDPRVKASAQRWLQGLRKGVRCKLFLQGQWVTAHLLWRSDNGEFFMFTSAIAGGMHSMTRRALERLRIEGLATTFVEPSLMQRAVDSVLQDLDEA